MLDTRGLVLGEIAVRERLLTREQLDQCLAHQEGNGFSRSLGAVMTDLGFVRTEQITALLERQKTAIDEYQRVISVSGLFGRIAVQRKYITETQLSRAVREQLRQETGGEHERIGRILLRLKFMNPEQVWDIIRAQHTFTCGKCGHTLDRPRFEKAAVNCEKCGETSVKLDDA